jgi:thiamine-phosphate pyrophosphorylase
VPGLNGDEIRRRLADARLYLCTDARRDRGDLAEFVDAALSGGVDIVQLRDKAHARGPLEARDELAALEVLAEACARHGALLAVNDRADIAVAAGADILHLGQDDLPVHWARRVAGDAIAIGRSTHDAEQADAAAVEPGVDYFCTGPCWPTPTKPGRPAPGLGLVRHVAAQAERTGAARPWFAIGGIDDARLPEVLAAGARRVVVVRVVTEADDPAQTAERLATQLRAASTHPPGVLYP